MVESTNPFTSAVAGPLTCFLTELPILNQFNQSLAKKTMIFPEIIFVDNMKIKIGSRFDVQYNELRRL